MRRAMVAALLSASSMFFAVGMAHATLFNGSYIVTANSNPATGLAVGTLNDFGSSVTAATNSFIGLNVGPAPHFVDLFELFSLEDPITASDTAPQAISVAFNFTSPFPGSGVINGFTSGVVNLDEGVLTWNGPLHVTLGNLLLNIALSNAEFGSDFNGVVTATFSVPEPGTLALIAIGLIGAGSFPRRRTRA
jgi:hypothetical protein